jgi:prepilin-type N-terminal cleavage/methylation domain-containing protein
MTKNKKGFTIIEVVLVLAIAGLIFLMVFIALPALQRSQRNTQREDDLARFITAANDYQSNNNGRTPFDSGTNKIDTLVKFTKKYVDGNCTFNASVANVKDAITNCAAQFTDPDGETYVWDVSKFSARTGKADKTAGDLPVSVTDTQDVDHNLYVSINSTCGIEEGNIQYDPGKRNFTILYNMEGSATSCNDNH